MEDQPSGNETSIKTGAEKIDDLGLSYGDRNKSDQEATKKIEIPNDT